MTKDPFDWVDTKEEEIKEERSKEYFDIVEGAQQFVLLSHCAPLAQVFDPATKKYRLAQEGDRAPSIKGVCWVLHGGVIKQAKLPYTVVKAIRAYSQKDEEGNSAWDFEIPFPHVFTLTAKGAGTKEVKYSIIASPKKIEIPRAILEELKKKQTPEQMVERIKTENAATKSIETEESEPPMDYPVDEINPDDIPF